MLNSPITQYHAYRKFTRNRWVGDTKLLVPNGVHYKGVPPLASKPQLLPTRAGVGHPWVTRISRDKDWPYIGTYFIEIILQILATTPIHLVSHTPRSTSPSLKAAAIPQLLNSWSLVQPDNSLRSGCWSDSSLIPRPYQPQCWLLSASCVGKEGLVIFVMFPCSLQEFMQSQ